VSADEASRLRVSNEFATVDVRLRHMANGVVLELNDPQSGNGIRLDALELEALTRLTIAQRGGLVDPSAARPGGEPAGESSEGLIGW
jgi:hypothetical protein